MDPVILDHVSRLLNEGHELVVVTVVERSGSIPSPLHSALLVYGDGSLGTVGGGLLEAKAMDEAKVLLGTGGCRTVTITLTAQQVSDEGSLCGGTVTLLLEAISEATAGPWIEAREALEAGEAGLFMVCITLQQEHIAVAREWVGARQLDRLAAFHTEGAAAVADNLPSAVRTAEGMTMLDPVHPPDELLVFGAGHLSQALVPLAHSIGFRCRVIDDRSEFACPERFPHAFELIVARPESAVSNLPSGSHVWAVVVTRGHKDDAVVLRELLRRDYRYVGMIGSKRKKEMIFKDLEAEGARAETLRAVHCPIGLPLGGSSPTEIAVSITAELLAVKYAKKLAVIQ